MSCAPASSWITSGRRGCWTRGPCASPLTRTSGPLWAAGICLTQSSPPVPVLDPGTLALEGFRPYNVPQMTGALLAALAISSNVVISLGMVGALSIVRFRTAVKDPLDLLYLFWSITAGITTGAGMYLLAVAASAVMIGMVVFLSRWQTAGRSYVAVLHYQGEYHG